MADEAKTRWRAIVSQPVDVADFRPLSSDLAVEVAAVSLCGRLHTHNTDHYLALRFGRLQETLVTSLAAGDLPPRFEEYAYAMLVADGLGEAEDGARASRVALSTLARLAIKYGRWNVRADEETLAEIVQQGEFFYRRANDAIMHARQADLHLTDMATSLTALYISEDHLTFAHVGHSRAYLLRNGELVQLTKDHVVAYPADVEQFQYIKQLKSDFGHIVLKAVGDDAAAAGVEIEQVTLSGGDRLLLCTNGLTDLIDDDRIADTLALKRQPGEDCERLVDLARSSGAPDDVTVMVADYRHLSTRSTPTPPIS
jgi:PPM family protein phosphatase